MKSCTVYQLLQFRAAIKLEKLGMKHSRGSVAAHVRKLFDLPRRTSHDDLLVILNETLEGIKNGNIEALGS